MRVRDFIETIDISNRYQLIVIQDENETELSFNIKTNKMVDWSEIFDYSLLSRDIEKISICDYDGLRNTAVIRLKEKEKE